MKVDFNEMLYAFSYALDCVEHELVGVTTHHSKRVAYLCLLLGRSLGFNQQQIRNVTACAVLHDNALTEYIKYEFLNGVNILENTQAMDLGLHCRMGEANMKYLPFNDEITNAILYHHENADGTGPFGKSDQEVPLYAQLIHVADQVDATLNLGFVDHEKFAHVIEYVNQGRNTLFSSACVDAFLAVFTYEVACLMQSEKIDILLNDSLPELVVDYNNKRIQDMAILFANIIDYKSEFTRRHSMGIAQKSMEMTVYYGYDEDTAVKMYLAGALHDLGKLVIDKDVLEKPGKLTDEEYRHIQNHAYYTYDILRRIKGMEDITRWASFHHEKLDGTGYPFGKKAEELTKLERLMCCLDIYQALTEERPYKESMAHHNAMKILRNMAMKNQLDAKIVEDIDCVFGA